MGKEPHLEPVKPPRFGSTRPRRVKRIRSSAGSPGPPKRCVDPIERQETHNGPIAASISKRSSEAVATGLELRRAPRDDVVGAVPACADTRLPVAFRRAHLPSGYRARDAETTMLDELAQRAWRSCATDGRATIAANQPRE